jgi:hypothetical protein
VTGDATSGRAARAPLVLLALAGIVASAVALGLAPLLMPDDYSWVANTTSESGAQGVGGAWAARVGFLLFGLAVLVVAYLRASAWPRVATYLHVAFGVLLAAVAAFSVRSWRPGASFDSTEDALHSVAATAMGFAFAFGVAAVLALRPHVDGGTRRATAVVAIVASVALPGAMGLWPDARGVFQRAMFLVAYVWYAAEALAAPRPTAPPPSRDADAPPSSSPVTMTSARDRTSTRERRHR